MLIAVSGNAGRDDITIDASLGTIRAVLDGGDGSDVLRLLHKGNSLEMGGGGKDTLISGFGTDVLLGGDGDDLLRWDPGTINDTMDGGNGIDQVLVIGNDTFRGQVANDQCVSLTSPFAFVAIKPPWPSCG